MTLGQPQQTVTYNVDDLLSKHVAEWNEMVGEAKEYHARYEPVLERLWTTQTELRVYGYELTGLVKPYRDMKTSIHVPMDKDSFQRSVAFWAVAQIDPQFEKLRKEQERREVAIETTQNPLVAIWHFAASDLVSRKIDKRVYEVLADEAKVQTVNDLIAYYCEEMRSRLSPKEDRAIGEILYGRPQVASELYDNIKTVAYLKYLHHQTFTASSSSPDDLAKAVNALVLSSRYATGDRAPYIYDVARDLDIIIHEDYHAKKRPDYLDTFHVITATEAELKAAVEQRVDHFNTHVKTLVTAAGFDHG